MNPLLFDNHSRFESNYNDQINNRHFVLNFEGRKLRMKKSNKSKERICIESVVHDPSGGSKNNCRCFSKKQTSEEFARHVQNDRCQSAEDGWKCGHCEAHCKKLKDAYQHAVENFCSKKNRVCKCNP